MLGISKYLIHDRFFLHLFWGWTIWDDFYDHFGCWEEIGETHIALVFDFTRQHGRENKHGTISQEGHPPRCHLPGNSRPS